MLRIATRGSALARWQADHVAALLGGDAELVVVQTEGDRRTDVALHELGGQGVFVKEIQAAVLDGRADIAVHSAKDLPSSFGPDGLTIGGVPERGDVRDGLVGCRLADLPEGATVATGSVRRRSQLAALRPDLRFEGLRGNMETRVARATGGVVVVVAVAALQRLGLADRITEVLEPSVMLPQVGQGALAIECRVDDAATRRRLLGIEHRPSRIAVDAERAFLRTIGGGCDAPVGAYATVTAGGAIDLEVLVAAPDGSVVERRRAGGSDPEAVGATAASLLPPELLQSTGQ
ncbi:MAG: hydroxymethylbilane synthase [Acidimicrobiales bacterium]